MLLGALAILIVVAQAPSVQSQIADLKARAVADSAKIRELSAKTDFTTTDDGLKLLKQYVDDLTEIKERLRQLQAEYDAKHLGAAAKTQETDQKKVNVGGLFEFQYQNTNQHGATNNAFAMRRLRLIENAQIDSRTAAGFS